MKKRSELKNVSASVRARLLKISKASGQDFNLLLVRYCIERLLYRLSMSEHNVRFVLKGALLFSVWHPIPHRVTRDLDLLGFGSREVQDLVAVFRDVCSVAVEDDGIVFDVESIAGESIRAEELYAGIRITLLAMIGAARLHVQVDVGFGDSVAVQPVEIAFPSLLDMPTPLLRAYRMETSVAEKFDAILTRGLLNTRMKDYFDLWFLAKNFAFDGALLAKSLKATCGRRGHPLNPVVPEGLSEAFWSDRSLQTIWETFWGKNVQVDPMLSLQEAVAFIASFLLSPMMAAAQDQPFTASWKPGGPWESP